MVVLGQPGFHDAAWPGQVGRRGESPPDAGCAAQGKQIIGNIVAAMRGVPGEIYKQQVARFTRCDADTGVALPTDSD
ncbi:MAG: hypothetical protein FD165_641 [Gammaproteobacteria bacterium]|nr:MAG: hypothetical protein FD165_641 [Gammaproteobacteria bacterium]TND02095.1 MAG: hypothetical protein FD120_2259 [Gammaproteobacteria bacterium]